MKPSYLVALVMGMVVLVTVAQGLVCSPWVSRQTTLVYNGTAGTCYGPQVQLSGNNWRLCCTRFGQRRLSMDEPVEPFISERVGARSFEKCTRWMAPDVNSYIPLAEGACDSSLVSQSKDGEMRICCV